MTSERNDAETRHHDEKHHRKIVLTVGDELAAVHLHSESGVTIGAP
jgi:CelD/BcsL family acetyltransferase involved in cellulose biosynthesis